MSEFNRNDISNYSWVPDKNADHKIEIGGSAVSDKKARSGRLVFGIVVVALCVVLSGFAAFGASYLANVLADPSGTPAETTSDASEVGGVTGSPSITVNKVESSEYPRNPEDVSTVASIVSKVGSSVVEISTETAVGGNIFSQYIRSGAGSGVIIAKEGYIITNNHVIDGADSIVVRTTDGTEYKAKLIGTDAAADVAVIKIDAADTTLNIATLGNSDELIVGEPVIAIGNPLGKLGGSVTNGIISALDREILVEGERMKLLQHNAAVNPGNSGGALFNAKGELIGIVNAKSTGEDVEGIGFAIPINDAYAVTEQLIEYGYVRGRVYLGLNYIDIQDAYDAMYYRVNAFGVYVLESEYIEDLKQGDRIAAIDGEEVSSYSDLKSLIAKKNVGDEIVITVVRKGKVIDVKAICREYVPSDNTVNFEQ